MKRIICVLISLAIILTLAGCSQSGKTTDVKIDYGESELFSRKDRKDAVQLILDEVKTWEGVKTLHNIRYAGDNEALKEKGYIEHEEIIVFYSDFKTVTSSSKAGGFNTNTEYTDWKWILGKNADGSWELLTWGY